MLHPSYKDLMKVVNKEVEEGDELVVNSRYSIVTATAKRARQLIDGAEPQTKAPCDKPFSIAVAELYEGKVNILTDEEFATSRITRELEAERQAAEIKIQRVEDYKEAEVRAEKEAAEKAAVDAQKAAEKAARAAERAALAEEANIEENDDFIEGEEEFFDNGETSENIE